MTDSSANPSLNKLDCIGKGGQKSVGVGTLDACDFHGEVFINLAPGLLYSYDPATNIWQAHHTGEADKSIQGSQDSRTLPRPVSGHCTIYRTHEAGADWLFCGNFSQETTALAATPDNQQPFSSVPFPSDDTRHISALLGWNSKLYALTESKAGEQKLYATDDPFSSSWELMDLPTGLADHASKARHLAIFNERLYLAVDNTVTGFQLWCLELGTDPDSDWQLVLGEGAYQYSASAHVTSLLVTEEILLIATAAESSLLELEKRPVAPELIAVNKDNDWMLIVGTTRTTNDGLAVPTSCMGRGFDNNQVIQIPAICRCDDSYFALTVLQPVQDGPPAQLWQSRNLTDWEPFRLPEQLGTDTRIFWIHAIQDNLLLAVERHTTESGPGESREGSNPESAMVDGLPQGIEFFLLHT